MLFVLLQLACRAKWFLCVWPAFWRRQRHAAEGERERSICQRNGFGAISRLDSCGRSVEGVCGVCAALARSPAQLINESRGTNLWEVICLRSPARLVREPSKVPVACDETKVIFGERAFCVSLLAFVHLCSLSVGASVGLDTSRHSGGGGGGAQETRVSAFRQVMALRARRIWPPTPPPHSATGCLGGLATAAAAAAKQTPLAHELPIVDADRRPTSGAAHRPT